MSRFPVVRAGVLPATRSAYLEQVRQIAPPALDGREAELAELARFCTGPDGPSYAWWRAGPSAGKSALLSSFVSCAPAEVAGRARLVSFFVTARLAAQDTREATSPVSCWSSSRPCSARGCRTCCPRRPGTHAAGPDVPGRGPETQEEGARLVLVVDGLDEDRGAGGGPGADSIAGLLPGNPPHGMRVIVAGRPDPPVPGDVPDWHPLRDPAIIRPLAPSPHARDIERLSSQELKRLLQDDGLGHDVLGLLTAARGGLSAADLADLADADLWDVRRFCTPQLGGLFKSVPASWASPAARTCTC